MAQQVLPTPKFPPRGVSLPSHTVPPPQALPIIEEKVIMKASWLPAQSGLHFIAGGFVPRFLHENTRRAERVSLAGWVGCAGE